MYARWRVLGLTMVSSHAPAWRARFLTSCDCIGPLCPTGAIRSEQRSSSTATSPSGRGTRCLRARNVEQVRGISDTWLLECNEERPHGSLGPCAALDDHAKAANRNCVLDRNPTNCHVTRSIANPSKGGDAKPPVFGL